MRVLRSETHGADRFVRCELAGDDTVTITLRQAASAPLGADAGGTLRLGFDPQHAHLFGADGLRRSVSLPERVPA